MTTCACNGNCRIYGTCQPTSAMPPYWYQPLDTAGGWTRPLRELGHPWIVVSVPSMTPVTPWISPVSPPPAIAPWPAPPPGSDPTLDVMT